MKLRLKILLFLFLAAVSCVYGQEQVNLDQAIEIAIKNSPTIKVYKEQVMQAKGNIRLADAALNPTISGSVDYTRKGPKIEQSGVVLSPDQTSNGGVTVAMPIDIGGVYSLAQKGAKYLYNSSEYDLLTGVYELVYNVKIAYLNVLLCKENIETAQSGLNLSKEYLAKVKNEVEAGTKAKFDITRQEYDLATRQNMLTDAECEYNIAINNFNNVLGKEKDFVVPADVENVDFANVSDLNADLISVAYGNRTELMKALKDKEVAKLYLVYAKKAKNPALNIAGNYTHLFINQTETKRDQWSAGANLSIPIFDGGNQDANVKINESKVSASEKNVDLVRQGIVTGVNNAKLSVNTASSQIITCESGLKLAQEAYDISKLRYESNLGTYLDVLESLNSLISAKNSLTNAKYSHAMNLCALERQIATTEKVYEYANSLFEDVNAKEKHPVKIVKGEENK